MKYPENFLKGIPNKQFLTENNFVSTDLFYFKQKRVDGALEQSINWEDDKDAIEFTLKQKKQGGILQFKSGVAIVSRERIDELINRPAINGFLSYERDVLRENKYHGNLLLRRSVSKPQMKQIAAGIALAVSKVIQNP